MTPPPRRLVARRTRPIIAHDVAQALGALEWEERELARLSYPTLLVLARTIMPGYGGTEHVNGQSDR